MPQRNHPHWFRLLVFLCLAVGLLSPGTVLARPAAAVKVVTDEIKLDFPRSVTFHLSASSDQKIERVSLVYGVNSVTCLDGEARKEMDVTPGKEVDTEWEWRLDISGSLPQGVEVRWRWEITDESGAVTKTEPKSQRIEDPNFTWQKLEQPPVTVYWAEGSSDFGRSMLDIAVNSIERLEQNAGLAVTDPIQLILYPSAADMRDSLVFISEWAGGVAFSEYRITLIGIAPGEISWAQEVIPHELAHLVTGMRIANCQGGSLPTWLNEGISQYAEGPVTAAAQTGIKSALDRGKLPPLGTLSNGFPSNSELANQAYDQSWMVVSFILDTYGKEKFEQLLDAIKAGDRIDKALRGVYGLDTDGMDLTWRASLGYGTAPEPGNPTETPPPVKTKIPTLALKAPGGKATATPASGQVEVPAATATPTPLQPTATVERLRPTDMDVLAVTSEPARAGGSSSLWILAGGAAVVLVLGGLGAVLVVIMVLKRKN